jgi:hypothetical protein
MYDELNLQHNKQPSAFEKIFLYLAYFNDHVVNAADWIIVWAEIL